MVICICILIFIPNMYISLYIFSGLEFFGHFYSYPDFYYEYVYFPVCIFRIWFLWSLVFVFESWFLFRICIFPRYCTDPSPGQSLQGNVFVSPPFLLHWEQEDTRDDKNSSLGEMRMRKRERNKYPKRIKKSWENDQKEEEKGWIYPEIVSSSLFTLIKSICCRLKGFSEQFSYLKKLLYGSPPHALHLSTFYTPPNFATQNLFTKLCINLAQYFPATKQCKLTLVYSVVGTTYFGQ